MLTNTNISLHGLIHNVHLRTIVTTWMLLFFSSALSSDVL